MSAAVTNRANHRPSKDKHAKPAIQPIQSKAEGPPPHANKATAEQLRIAMIISDDKDDTEFQRRMEQVMEITSKTKEVCAIALQDCKNDPDRAIEMLIEGDSHDGVGEWKETGKKKKRQQPTPTVQKTESVTNTDDKSQKNEQNTDSEKPDRRENKENRKGSRRFDSRPPRLSRGRGRDKPEFFRTEKVNGESDNSDINFGTFREGGFDDRGRGRGRGGRGRGRGGRGRGAGTGSGRGGRSFDRGPKFEMGPQIDTWTNETAVNADKEPSIGSWGDGMEDWSEDQWNGSLKESKVFTASAVQNDSTVETSAPLTDSTNSLGQRLDLGALLNKQSDSDAYISYNQQATESIKNSIGIGSNSRQSSYPSSESTRPAYSSQENRSAFSSQDQSGFGNQAYSHQDARTFNSQDTRSTYSGPDSRSVFSSQDTHPTYGGQDSRSSFTSQESRSSYNDSSRQSFTNTALTNHLQSSTLASQLQAPNSSLVSQLSDSSAASAAVDALVSSLTHGQNLTTTALEQLGDSSVLPVSQSSTPDSTPQVLQQRPKPQRSKLPPPSKIPASAVEMPGHQRTNVDVQFGNWEIGTDSSFSFGVGDTLGSDGLASSLPSSSSSTMNNHLSQVSKQSESVMSSTRISTPPTAGSNLSSQESPRQSMFQNSPYTTPTKQDQNSIGQQKMSPPDPIPFPSDRKSSPHISSQRPSSNSSLSQGSVSTSNQDGSLNYSQIAPGSYQSNFHQPQTSVLSNSSGLNSSMGLNREAPGLNRDSSGLQSTSLPRDSSSIGVSGLSNDSGVTGAPGLSVPSVLTSSSSLTNSAGLSLDSNSLSNSTTLGNSGGLSNSSGLSNTGSMSSSGGLKNAPGFSSSSQSSSYQNQYQTGSNQYQPSQNQYNQSGQNQYQSGSSQYGAQNQYQSYGQSGTPFHNQSSYSGSSNYGNSSQSSQNTLYQTTNSNSYQSSQNSLYHQGNSSQSSSFQQGSQSSYHSKRDSQAPGSYSANAGQSSSTSYQRDSQTGLSTPSTQSQMSYSSQNYPNNLTSPLNTSQISDTLSKMTVKENSLDTRQSPQYDSSPSTTTSTLPTTSSSALSSGKSTPSAVTSSVITTSIGNSSRVSNANFTSPTGSITSKAPPNLPPGVQLLGHQYIMGQAGTLPYFAGLQQPLYGYEDLQMLQQRLPPLANYNYDLSGFGVPTSVPGRDQTSLGSVPYTGTDNKMQRVDAQSPIPSTPTQQSTPSTGSHQQQQQQHFNILPYGYYYPSAVLPNAAAAAGFQFPQAMFPVPPVTNAAHAGTSANAQFQKTYGSHTYVGNKGYDDLTPQSTDFAKTGYVSQSQNKVSTVSGGSVSAMTGTADLTGSAYSKTHTQGFDKPGFHAGTPPPFNLPLATGTQAGPLGAPTAPYGAPFVPMMPHQAHSQMMHPGLQQDTSSVTSRGSHLLGQQSSTQSKASQGKAYGAAYWGAN